MVRLVEKIQAGLIATIEAMEYRLWGVELLGRGAHTKLRVYIDHPDGIDIDDCAKVSRQVSRILDVEEWLDFEYALEVSSPGLDRSFFEWHQLVDYVGERLSIKLKQPFDGRSHYKGMLKNVNQARVVIMLHPNKKVVEFEFDALDKVQLLASV